MRRFGGALVVVALALSACSSGQKIQSVAAGTATPEPSATFAYTIETPIPPTPVGAPETAVEPSAARTAAPTAPPTVAPTRAPATGDTCGAPANPWGYNFCARGGYITSPPSNFCSYFNCIPNFPNGVGYVIECQDHMFSKSGGRSGSCSHHGGNGRTLYSGP